MIGENLGVSILPESIAKKVDKDKVRAIPITNPSLPYELGIIKKKDKYATHATKELIKMLREFSE